VTYVVASAASKSVVAVNVSGVIIDSTFLQKLEVINEIRRRYSPRRATLTGPINVTGEHEASAPRRLK
jgi:hypothetical protein